MRIVSSGRPFAPCFLVISLPVMVPTTRLTLRIGKLGDDFFAAFDRRLADVEELRDVERLVDAVVLLDLAEAADLRTDFGLIEDVARNRGPWPSSARRPSSLRGDRCGRSSPRWCGNPSCAMISRTSWAMNLMKFTTCSGLPVILRAQLRILRGDAGRTRIQMANTHHDAAGRHERRGRKTELLGAEQRGDDDVAAGLELAVGFNGDAASEDC